MSMESREYRHVVGLALDTRRLDQIQRAVKASEDPTALLSETVTKVLGSQLDRSFRSRVLDVLLRLFSELEEPDFVSMCQCLIKLEKPGDVADILNRLVKNPDGELLAYQISFDLYENATQQFIQQIEKALIPVSHCLDILLLNCVFRKVKRQQLLHQQLMLLEITQPLVLLQQLQQRLLLVLHRQLQLPLLQHQRSHQTRARVLAPLPPKLFIHLWFQMSVMH